MLISLSESIVLKQIVFGQHAISSYINNICSICNKCEFDCCGTTIIFNKNNGYLCGNCYFKCKIEMENYKTFNAKKIVVIKHLLCDDIGILIYKNIVNNDIEFFNFALKTHGVYKLAL